MSESVPTHCLRVIVNRRNLRQAWYGRRERLRAVVPIARAFSAEVRSRDVQSTKSSAAWYSLTERSRVVFGLSRSDPEEVESL